MFYFHLRRIRAMGIIFAIGGGEVRHRETLAIDRKIVKAAETDNPRLLFIPTASSEAPGYVKTVEEYFGGELGCRVDTLFLLDDRTNREEARSKILDSHIIYVGGGNTRLMMKVWNEYGVDEALKEAYKQGVILSGLSAGSICWFDCGQSDSDFTDKSPQPRYSCVDGLGLIPLLHSPHHNEDHRASDLPLLVGETGKTALALSNGCALEVHGDSFRFHKSQEKAYALKVENRDNEIQNESLSFEDTYSPLTELTR